MISSVFFFEGLAAFLGMIILLSYAYLHFALNFGKIIIPNSALTCLLRCLKGEAYVFAYIKRGYAGAWDRAV